MQLFFDPLVSGVRIWIKGAHVIPNGCVTKARRRKRPIRRYRWICPWGILFTLWAGGFMGWAAEPDTEAAIPLGQSSESSETSEEQRIASMVEAFYASDDAPPLVGLSVAVITPQGTIRQHFGSTGLITPTGECETPSDTTYYEIASLSKTLSALLLAEAYRRGEIEPETTLGELYWSASSHGLSTNSVATKNSAACLDSVASFDSADSAGVTAERSFPASGVTVESLATHTSGLPRLPENFIPYMEKTPENPYADYPETALREAIFTTSLQTPKYEYSNFGYAILTDVLCDVARPAAQTSENKSGYSVELTWNYSKLLETRVLNPLGMNDTWVQDTTCSSDARLSRYALPHDAVGNSSHRWNFRTFQGGGAIVSTLADMTRYGEALLGLNQSVAPTPLADSIRMTQRIHTVVNAELAIGLGWHQRPDGVLLWHDGETGGYHSFIALNQAEDCAVILLANCANAQINRLGLQLLESSAVAKAPSDTAPEKPFHAAPHEDEERETSVACYPTSGYTIREIRGWQCYFAADLTTQKELDTQVCELPDHQLCKVTYALPEPVVERLREVKIWIQRKDPYVDGVCYHPSVEWLREHGVNPDKEKSIDIPNAEYFLTEVARQPMMILHELAHAWQDRFLPDGYGNAEIQNAYQKAMQAGIYEQSLCNDDHTSKAYGATNPMEYFAELSECYFGENDFFPFVRIELKKHDPTGYAMVEKLWRWPIETSVPHVISSESAETTE